MAYCRQGNAANLRGSIHVDVLGKLEGRGKTRTKHHLEAPSVWEILQKVLVGESDVTLGKSSKNLSVHSKRGGSIYVGTDLGYTEFWVWGAVMNTSEDSGASDETSSRGAKNATQCWIETQVRP